MESIAPVCFACKRAAAEVLLLMRLQGDLACPDCFERVLDARPLPFSGAVGGYRADGTPWQYVTPEDPVWPPRPPLDEGEPDPAPYYVLAFQLGSYVRDQMTPPGAFRIPVARWLRARKDIAPIWQPAAVAPDVAEEPATRGAPPRWTKATIPPLVEAIREKRRELIAAGDRGAQETVAHALYEQFGYATPEGFMRVFSRLRELGYPWPSAFDAYVIQG